MTEEERQSHLGGKLNETNSLNIENGEVPQKREYKEKRALSKQDWSAYFVDAKDQKQCGSCWTFGAAGVLEFQINRYSYQNIALSEQNLLDCTYEKSEPKRDGCNGGDSGDAWRWIKSNGNSIAYMADYPYQQADGRCRSGFANAMSDYTVASVNYVDYGNPNDAATRDAVALRALAGYIKVQGGFNYYKSGVYYEDNCTGINHAIIITGYGTENGVDYFNVRNSWGKYWGQNGYIKMRRGTNTCNVARYGQWAEIGFRKKKWGKQEKE